MDYTDLIVDTTGLYGGFTAPEEICNFSREKWLSEFEKAGLTFLAGEGKQHPLSENSYLIFWFVGDDEYWYYVTLDVAAYRVTIERKGKAQKSSA